MRYSFIFIFIIYIVGCSGTRKCKYQKCRTDVFAPVCGKKLIKGRMTERIFRSQCYLDNANACREIYKPCVDNICPAPRSVTEFLL